MTDYQTIAVIDIGKTNAKVVLIEAESGRALGQRAMPNAARQDGPYPHADTDGLWAFITASLSELNAVRPISAISITTHGATAALIGGDGLVLPVLDYEHDGPEEMRAAYEEMKPAFAESLTPRLPNGLALGAQLFWQHASFEDEFARASAILTYPQYWAWRLTGVLASELTSIGCHTDLWSHPAADFSSLVTTMGWRERFPAIQPAASVLGTLRPDLARTMGLADVPVACGIHDSNASLMPHLGRREAPFTVISTGTWTICMTVGGDPSRLDPARDSLANIDAFGRTVPTARFMGGREFDQLVGQPMMPATDADLDRMIAQKVMVLPSLTPGVGPFPDLNGGWSHDPAGLSSGERYAAASLYLGLLTDVALTLSGVGRSIVIEGPLARNQAYAQTLARVSGVPVETSVDATGTSLGASLLLGGTAGQPAAQITEPLNHAGFDSYRRAWLGALRT